MLYFVTFFTYYFPLENIFFATKNGSGDGGGGGGGDDDGGQRCLCYPCPLSVFATLYIHSILKTTIAFIFNLLIYSNVYNF